ncbi:MULTISPECIES: hypothetical protein [Aerosakkonema]|uniref:hypothetical protein n=1 Tax=Aerosakkonema TaxID=1246629 RepID=UPI0035B93B0E
MLSFCDRNQIVKENRCFGLNMLICVRYHKYLGHTNVLIILSTQIRIKIKKPPDPDVTLFTSPEIW